MLRWGELNGTVLDRQGEVGEGTSIDFEEPVVITIQCDADGWVMQVGIQNPGFQMCHSNFFFLFIFIHCLSGSTGE